jgi:hypothetical protein
MSTTAEHKLVVLFDHEVRVAAKALEGLRALADTKCTKEEWSDAALHALDACQAALLGAEDDGAAITISSAPVSFRTGKTRKGKS